MFAIPPNPFPVQASLLANPRTHVYLSKVLPRFSDALHDVNEGVRGAMVDLLIAVKGIRALKFWDICPLGDLLARMEVDRKPLSNKIHQLLSNSFFPDNTDEATKIERAIYLIKENRLASRKFYDHCRKTLSLPESVKFMLAVLIHLKRFVKAKVLGRSEDESDVSLSDADDSSSSNGGNSGSLGGSDAGKENAGCSRTARRPRKRKLHSNSGSMMDLEAVAEASMSSESDSESTTSSNGSSYTSLARRALSDSTNNSTSSSSGVLSDVSGAGDPNLESAEVVCGLVDIVCIFWVSIGKDLALPQNAPYRSLLEKKAAKIMNGLFKFYRGHPEVVGPVVYLCR